MSWHTVVLEPIWILPTAVGIGTLTLIGISVGGIWYFLETRKSLEVKTLSNNNQTENPVD